MKSQLKNLVLFKIGWVACVAFAAAGNPTWAIASVAAIVALHLASVAVPVKEALFLSASALIGLLWETVLVQTGLFAYPANGGPTPLAPYWIIAMWALFATTINYGMRWIKKSWLIAAVVGLVGGPIAFYAGASVGAVEFRDTFWALIAVGVGWAFLLPFLCIISDTIIDSAWLEPPQESRAGPNYTAFKRELSREV